VRDQERACAVSSRGTREYTCFSMRRYGIWPVLLLASLLTAATARAAEISWTLPATHRDGTPIAPPAAARIVVEVYWGPTKDGPWEPVASSCPGATTATVPDPPPARTRWYTAKSTLDGVKSGFAPPVRRTNYSIPIPLAVKKIVRKALERKKAVVLLVLALFAVLLWMFRLRRDRKGG
jgi:hypothetical protein